MSNTYTEGQDVSLDLNSFSKGGEFKALVTIKSSRYVELKYPPDMNITPKTAIRWTFISTKGTEFSKDYSLGITFNEKATISEDGRKLKAKAGFTGPNESSDGYFLLYMAAKAGFTDSVTTDIGVFDGATFTIRDEKNPKAKNSKPKAYPIQFHPEGMAAVLAASGKTQGVAAQSSAAVEEPTNIAPEVVSKASEALKSIVASSGGSVTRMELPMKLGSNEVAKTWDMDSRKAVTYALWDMPGLSAVVAASSGLKLVGETVTSQ